jgi:DNA-binding IclR family transcriptional regulator
VSEAAAVTGRDRGLVSRLLTDLVALELVSADATTRRYRLSWRLFASAVQVTATRLPRRGKAAIEALAAQTGESAYLVVRYGAHAQTAAEATRPHQAVYVTSWVGRSVPIVRSDAGPSLVLGWPHEAIRELIGDGPLPAASSPQALRSADDFLRCVEALARDGVSRLPETTDAGVTSLAAPVFDFQRRVVCSLVLSGPADRMRDRMDSLGPVVRRSADALSTRLGAEPT